ncbi:hypothetical protein ACF1HU_06275 [Streptomyces olivaceus]|uniref:hypothetical protein n=1 Tax=Streptomyces olivaceus TaxID=47716 RepID=UPI0036AE4618
MSEAFFQWVQAGPVAPGVDFALPPAAPPVPAPDPVELTHTGALHVDGTTEEVAHHLGDLASEAAQQAADAAVQVLGTLSGALLAGRAALATTKVLAGAAVRAAEEQRCLERQEKISADAAEQWRNAAFAAARANARRTVLRARIARSAARPAPGDPPPRPDLPGPLDPTAGRLADFRCELARFERELAAAEKVQADWEAETFLATQAGAAGGDRDGRDGRDGRGGSGGRGPDGPDWQDAVRARRDAMVWDRPATEESPLPVPDPPRAAGPAGATGPADGATVRDQGADILASLDPQADADLGGMAAKAVEHALAHAGRPQRARRYLREARTLVADANRRAWQLRREAEQAAVQLDFLTGPLPDAPDLPDPDPEAVEALRRCVADQVPLTADERKAVEQSTAARCAALEALYLERQCTGVLARLAQDTEGDLRVGRPDGDDGGGDTVTLDWTPGDWDPDHWIRLQLRGEDVHVVTMRPATRGERRAGDLELDARRCAEAAERLDEFRSLAATAGLTLTFEMRHGEVLPGTRVRRTGPGGRTGYQDHRRPPGPRKRQHRAPDDPDGPGRT